MARFVPDAKSNRWVIIAPGRVSRPQDNLPAPARGTDPLCPFCPGAEAINHEVFRIGGQPGDRNWQVRVVINKYPITDVHEVIILSPNHKADLSDLSLEQIKLVFQVYRERYNYHVGRGEGNVFIFSNHDVHAGASLAHPHAQLLVVPKQITLDAIAREPERNVVFSTKYFTIYCPDFSQWPYEVWIAPNSKQNFENSSFGQITDDEITDLTPTMKKLTTFLHKKFSGDAAIKQKDDGPDVPYNYYIYHGADWYLRIIPRLVHHGGIELGTGLSVNIVDPSVAAEEYKDGLN